MKTINYKSIRLSAIAVATAFAITVPSVGNAGWFNQAKAKVQTVKSNVTSTARNVGQNMSEMEIIQKVQELNLKEQLLETIALMQQMQSDYQYFTGGSGCAADCARFRIELKNVLNEFISLVYDVPVLRADGALISNLERTVNIVDYIPPRALYLMWQSLDGQLEQIRTGVNEIRQQLTLLPPLQGDDNEVNYSADAQGTSSRSTSNNSSNRGDAFCGWVNRDQKAGVELLQARLEMFAWRLKSAADIIPDIEVKGEAGAAAGIFGSAGAGIKPTDQVKMLFQMIAYIPERINWAIKINSLRAKVGCQLAGY